MANFTRVKPLGWSLFDLLESALMNQLDIDHAKSVNGDDGGSWGGAGTFTAWSLTGTSLINSSGIIRTTGVMTSETSFVARTAQSFEGQLTQQAGADWNLLGRTDLTGEFHIAGTGHLEVDSGGELNVNSGGWIALLSGGLIDALNGSNIIVRNGGTLAMNGLFDMQNDNARFSWRLSTLPDSNANVGANADVWLVEKDLAADRTYTLDKTTHVPVDGHLLVVHRGGPTVNEDAIFAYEGGAQACRIDGDGSDGGWCVFIYRTAEANWRPLLWGGSANPSFNAGTY